MQIKWHELDLLKIATILMHVFGFEIMFHMSESWILNFFKSIFVLICLFVFFYTQNHLSEPIQKDWIL